MHPYASDITHVLGDMCGVKVLPLSEEGRLPGLEDSFWYHHLLCDVEKSITEGDQ
jgi:hypothetical protein